MLILRIPQHGQENPFYQVLPYEYVRFNVDTNPGVEAVIVPTPPPSGSNVTPEMKIYERIEFVDNEPLRQAAGGAFSATVKKPS
jgi:hypothetical protein